MCGVVPGPLVVKHILQPLVMSLPLGPHIALSLAALAKSVDSRVICMELLPSLVDVLIITAGTGAVTQPAVDSQQGLMMHNHANCLLTTAQNSMSHDRNL